MRRLALRAGVTKMQAGAHEAIRRTFFQPLRAIIQGAMELAVLKKKKKLSLSMIDFVLKKFADEGKLPRPYGKPGPESDKRGGRKRARKE